MPNANFHSKGARPSNQTRLLGKACIVSHVYQHGHSTGQMPQDMAVEQPRARIVSPESQNRVRPAGNVDVIS